MRVRVAEDSLIFEVYNTRRGKTQAKNRGNVLLFSRIRKFPRVLPPSDALYDREQVCRGYWESLRWFKVDDRPGHVAAPSFFLRYRQPTRLKNTAGMSDSSRFWKIDSMLIYAWESPCFSIF
jgi:hypothetical protein